MKGKSATRFKSSAFSERADAHERRIVCLSAILPDGDQLDDFAGWLRRDHPGGLIKHDWRPTRLRFGEVVWASPNARLNLRVGEERPWVQRFLTGVAPRNVGAAQTAPNQALSRRSTRTLPSDSLATGRRRADRPHLLPGTTVASNRLRDVIVDLHERGALRSLLEADPAVLATAIALGEEWLGPDSAILKCLRLGVAASITGLCQRPTGRRSKACCVAISSKSLSRRRPWLKA